MILIEPSNKSNSELLIELAKKLGSKVVAFSEEDAEEFKLLAMMKKVKTGENANRDEVMEKLRK